jgi:hypothetical protein
MTVGTVSFGHTPTQSAEVKLEAAAFVMTGVSATMEVHSAPFSEVGMSERFAADPVFYRNLASFVASELRRQANSVDGQGNSGQVVKGQLTELAEGFESTAAVLTTHEGILTPQAAQQAAEIITKLRETYAAFQESNPGLFDLAVIGLAGYVLHQFGGFDPNLSLLISSAVVKREKIADVIAAAFGKK